MMLCKAESTINNHAGGPDLQDISSLNLLYSMTVRGEIGNVSITVNMERASLQQD